MPSGKELQELKAENKLVRQLESQNEVHGMFGRVFMRAGGEEYLLQYALEQPGPFIKLVAGMSPGLIPQAGFQGDVSITINNTLPPTDLDADLVDVTDVE